MLLAPSLKGHIVFRKVRLNSCHHSRPGYRPILGAGNPGREYSAEPEAAG